MSKKRRKKIKGRIGGILGGGGSSAPKEVIPETDYNQMWSSYDKWQREDFDAYEKEQATNITDFATEKAKMARSGIQAGSEAWNLRIDAQKERSTRTDADYEAKKSALYGSSVYTDLQKEWKKTATEGQSFADWGKGRFASSGSAPDDESTPSGGAQPEQPAQTNRPNLGGGFGSITGNGARNPWM